MLRAELIKARTTRTVVALTIGAAVTAALGTASMTLSEPAEHIARPLHQQQFFFITAMVVVTFAAVLGVRAFTDEFRYGTIIPTFLAEPRRGRVVGAKSVVAALLALGMALLAQATMLAVAAGLAGTKGARLAVGGADGAAMLGLGLAAALWAVLGTGIGAALRHQVAAIVGVVIWVIVVENVLPSLAGGVAGLLPGRAAYALADATAAGDLPPRTLGAAALVAYAAVGALLGSAFGRRDVEPL